MRRFMFVIAALCLCTGSTQARSFSVWFTPVPLRTVRSILPLRLNFDQRWHWDEVMLNSAGVNNRVRCGDGSPATPVTGYQARLALKALFGVCKHTYIVTYSPGGYVYLYQAAAKQLRQEGKRMVIDGPCYSACAIIADEARPDVIITQRAAFYFHKAFDRVAQKNGEFIRIIRADFSDMPMAQDINRWVQAHGGYPIKGFTKMPYRSARRFWPRCILHPPLPPPPCHQRCASIGKCGGR